MASPLVVKRLGSRSYRDCWMEMKSFTDTRNDHTTDEFWLLEHPPVFTLGQAGKEEHILDAGNIEVVRADRGGQVTYHGPGQLVGYTLWDIKRKEIGIKRLVCGMESALIRMLDELGIRAVTDASAHGVFVEQEKIASLGFRIRKGCTYHGFSLNLDLELEPFSRINPCGYAGMKVTDIASQGVIINRGRIEELAIKHVAMEFGYYAVDSRLTV